MQKTLLVAALAAFALDAAAATRGFVALAIPPQSSQAAAEAAIDLDGNGTPENGLAAFFATLGTLGLDPAIPVQAGAVVYLLRVTSVDPAFATDAAARAEWLVGQPTAPTPPDFSGAGSFSLDTSYAPGGFTAPLVSSAFLSANPVTTTAPVTVPLQFVVGIPIVLPLNGARLRFSIAPGGLTSGQLNGSIKVEDIQNILVPAVAGLLNDLIAAGGSTATTVLALFDTGCSGVGANDGAISACEVNASFFGNILQPDVDIYNPALQYAPNPVNANPDSLSFGMSFTAANAIVPLDTVFASSFE